jgi:hypothetical protein
MPNSLRSALDSLAKSFAESVLDAIHGASLDELVAENRGASRRGPGQPDPLKAPIAKKTKGGRLARRSPEEIAKALDLVAKLLKTHPKGLRAEEIRKAFGLDAREMPRILKQGLAKKKLKSRGQKRATTYSAA